jgi:lysophospholipase L1-like esterase
VSARKWVTVGVLVIVIALAAAAAGYLLGARTDVAAHEPPTASPTPEAITFGVVGDSITAWTDRQGTPQPAGSWTTYANRDGVSFTELGWAQNGARLAEMGLNMKPVSADVLVVVAGTNDLRLPTTLPERLLLLDAIVLRANVEDVIISSVPPLNAAPQLSTAWNSALREHAAGMGWKFVDAWADVRAQNGTFATGTTPDGLHPTAEAAEAAGAALHDAILGTRK